LLPSRDLPAFTWLLKEKAMKKDIVEVAARTETGLTPLGIMNAEQAMALPEGLDIVVSEPEEEKLPTKSAMEEPDQADPL
jgi:hypothetical protein